VEKRAGGGRCEFGAGAAVNLTLLVVYSNKAKAVIVKSRLQIKGGGPGAWPYLQNECTPDRMV